MWRQLDGSDSRQGTIPQQVSHDDVYFLKDFVVIQIENSLFKIPRDHLIKQSYLFKEWSGDETNPLTLHDVTAQEFRHFLQIILPGFMADPVDFWVCTHQPSEEEWISVLTLSTKWFCLKMRRLAVEKLDSLANKKRLPAKWILLGRKYHIQDWVVSGYRNLLTRRAGISEQEENDIGLRESLKIMRMRETPCSADAVDAEINKVFKDELASIKARDMIIFFSPYVPLPVVVNPATQTIHSSQFPSFENTSWAAGSPRRWRKELEWRVRKQEPHNGEGS